MGFDALVLPVYRNERIAKQLVDYAWSVLNKERINKAALVAFQKIQQELLSGKVLNLQKKTIWDTEIKLFNRWNETI